MKITHAMASVLVGLAAPVILSGPLAAQSQPADGEQGEGLAKCRAIANDLERLGCYDRLVEGMPQTAVIIPAPVPAPAPVQAKSDGTSDASDKEDVAGSIVSLDVYPALQYAIVTLDNGQVWKTTSNGSLLYRLKVGQKVTIAPSAFSGYRLRIDAVMGYQGVRRHR